MPQDDSKPEQTRPWRGFAAEMIVPALLLGYGTHYYISVARLPKPETNLLLIGPVYWIMVICSVIFAGLKLRDALREIRRHDALGNVQQRKAPLEPSSIIAPDIAVDELNTEGRSGSAVLKESAAETEAVGWFRYAAFVFLTIACVWLMPILGFATTIAAYTLFMLLALGVRSIPLLLLTPTLLSGLLWIGMAQFLDLRLPTGFLI